MSAKQSDDIKAILRENKKHEGERLAPVGRGEKVGWCRNPDGSFEKAITYKVRRVPVIGLFTAIQLAMKGVR